MADGETLATFLDRLQASVERVQQVAAEQHQRQLDRYLDEDGMPLVQSVQVPNPLEPGWQEIEVPLLALVPATSIQLKELTIEFDATVDAVLDQPDAEDLSAVRETSVRLERPAPEGAGMAIVRVVFEAARAPTAHHADIGIRYKYPDEQPPAPVAPPKGSDGPPLKKPPSPPIKTTGRTPMVSDPKDDYTFMIDGAHLVDEKEIDVHEESATVVIAVGVEVNNSDSMWELNEARLLLDAEALPSTIILEGAEREDDAFVFPLDADELREGHGVEVGATVKTGTFAEPGGPAAKSGTYGMAARVEAVYVPISRSVTTENDGEITIEVAPD